MQLHVRDGFSLARVAVYRQTVCRLEEAARRCLAGGDGVFDVQRLAGLVVKLIDQHVGARDAVFIHRFKVEAGHDLRGGGLHEGVDVFRPLQLRPFLRDRAVILVAERTDPSEAGCRPRADERIDRHTLSELQIAVQGIIVKRNGMDVLTAGVVGAAVKIVHQREDKVVFHAAVGVEVFPCLIVGGKVAARDGLFLLRTRACGHLAVGIVDGRAQKDLGRARPIVDGIGGHIGGILADALFLRDGDVTENGVKRLGEGDLPNVPLACGGGVEIHGVAVLLAALGGEVLGAYARCIGRDLHCRAAVHAARDKIDRFYVHGALVAYREARRGEDAAIVIGLDQHVARKFRAVLCFGERHAGHHPLFADRVKLYEPAFVRKIQALHDQIGVWACCGRGQGYRRQRGKHQQNGKRKRHSSLFHCFSPHLL